MHPIKRRIIELVGPLSDDQVAKMFGRKSRIRLAQHSLGADQWLPDLPPIEKDESLRYEPENEVRRARNLARWKRNKNRAAKG